MTIPQADPRANYLAYRAEIDSAIARVLERGQYILGEESTAFESEFAAYVGVAHGIGVANGTDALTLALQACGVAAGMEVITVSQTAVATVAAIELAGAVPVLADIDPHTFTLDPARLEALLTPRTKAIIPVHLYGHPADMDAILSVAQRHKLRVIEDCAQAHGAEYRGHRVGSLGDMAAFSFYPTKNLGALGDAGMIVCSDSTLAEQARMLRQYGWKSTRTSEIAGANSRLDELQAAVLRVKLRHLDADNLKRRHLAQHYTYLLSESCLVLPIEQTWAQHAYHQYVISHPCRTAVQSYLAQKHILTSVHYPQPVHHQPAYRHRLKIDGSLERTERAAAEVLSLPLYPELATADVEYVATSLKEWCLSLAAQHHP